MFERAQIHQTPAGVAQDPWLTIPVTRINTRGQYKVTLLVATEKAQPLIALVDNALAQSLAQAKKDDPARAKRIKPTADKPYNKALEEDGKKTGGVSFHFGLLAEFTSKQTAQTVFKRPDLFDAKCRPLDPTRVNIGDGSTIGVAFEILPFYMFLLGAGVSLRLRAVQVLNLVKPPDRDAKSYGFVEEEGYEADESHAAAVAGRRLPVRRQRTSPEQLAALARINTARRKRLKMSTRHRDRAPFDEHISRAGRHDAHSQRSGLRRSVTCWMARCPRWRDAPWARYAADDVGIATGRCEVAL